MLDLTQVLRRLRRERDALDDIIQSLRDLQLREAAEAAMPKKVLKRRGRKFMDPGEREEVSKRMKSYWAQWREKSGKENGRSGKVLESM
jgi:hypothetical protein